MAEWRSKTDRSANLVVVLVVMVMMFRYVSAGVRRNIVDDDRVSVSLMRGVADTTASVGRLFRYRIHSDALKGSVTTYQLTESGKDRLPQWLHFVHDQNMLIGIPTPGDAGQVYLEITAVGQNGQKAKDIFSLLVSPDTPAMSTGSQPLGSQKSGQKAVRCEQEEPQTMAIVVVDADMNGISVKERMSLFHNFLTYMGLLENMVKMTPAKANLLHEETALEIGMDDVSKGEHPVLTLSWLIGCGKVEKGHYHKLQKLDNDYANNMMSKIVGWSVVGWRVTNCRLQQQQEAVKRPRRQVRATTTPGLTISLPRATDITKKRETDNNTETATDTVTHKMAAVMSVFVSQTSQTAKSSAVKPQTTTTTTGSMTRLHKTDMTHKMGRAKAISAAASPPNTADETRDDDDDILITTVVPVAIIILLSALFIVCTLYWRERKTRCTIETTRRL